MWNKKVLIGDSFKFFKKSKIKAGEGLDEGKYPFYTSSSQLTKYLNAYEVEGESLILGTGGNASIHHSYGEFSTSTDCFVLQINGKYDIDTKYVYLFLKGNIDILENGFKGAGLKHISKKYIEDIEMPVPPLETQKKIVEVLDKAQALIDARKEQIKLLDDLIQSTFYDMFGDPVTNPKGWDKKILRKYITIVGGYAFKSNQFTDDGIPIIKIGTVNKGFFDTSVLSYWNDEYNEKLVKYTVYPGDLLISLTGTVGKDDYGNVCIADDTYKKYYLNQRVAKLDIVSDINKSFLRYCFLQEKFKAELTKLSRGVRQANISNEDIYSLEIILPPIHLQNQFAEKVQKIESQKQLMQGSLEEMENNYNSLMQRAFKGELFA